MEERKEDINNERKERSEERKKKTNKDQFVSRVLYASFSAPTPA